VVVGEVLGGADPGGVRDQVARILSLDVDGTGFPEVGVRDPVVGGLQARWPGLRPVGFFSPYEAAAWALIGHRIRIVQAARVKERMAAELGQAVDIHGDVRHAFPGPAPPGWPASRGSRGCSTARSRTSAPWALRRWMAGWTGPGYGASQGSRPYGLDEPPTAPGCRSGPRPGVPTGPGVVLLLRVLLETETGEIRGTGPRGVGGRPGT
jgi:hypothetical protein